MGREQIEQTVEINEYKKQKPKEISHTWNALTFSLCFRSELCSQPFSNEHFLRSKFSLQFNFYNELYVLSISVSPCESTTDERNNIYADPLLPDKRIIYSLIFHMRWIVFVFESVVFILNEKNCNVLISHSVNKSVVLTYGR